MTIYDPLPHHSFLLTSRCDSEVVTSVPRSVGPGSQARSRLTSTLGSGSSEVNAARVLPSQALLPYHGRGT